VLWLGWVDSYRAEEEEKIHTHTYSGLKENKDIFPILQPVFLKVNRATSYCPYIILF
jgi:hypothetical protein